MKMYCVMHKSDYTDNDVKNMIYPYNIQHHYSRATYWEPEEDDIEYDISFEDDFHKVVQIAEFYYYDNENPYAVIINDNTYCLNEKDNWEEILKNLGWIFFEDWGDISESKEHVECELEDWINKIAEDRAWEIVNEEEGM